jgi:hypothetical protein
MLSVGSIVSVSPKQVSSDLAGEVAILNLGDGVYYGLDEIGAFIWKQIQQPRQVSDVRDALLEEYDVDAEECERDLLHLLGELQQRGLINVDDDQTTG